MSNSKFSLFCVVMWSFVYVSENFKTTTLPDYDIDEKCQLWKKREKYFFIGFENKLLIGTINMVFIS